MIPGALADELEIGVSLEAEVSRASRLSITVQLVEVPTISAPSRAAGASDFARRSTYLRASSNRPFDWSGRPQQSWSSGTSTLKPLCSRIATVFSPTSGSSYCVPRPWK